MVPLPALRVGWADFLRFSLPLRACNAQLAHPTRSLDSKRAFLVVQGPIPLVWGLPRALLAQCTRILEHGPPPVQRAVPDFTLLALAHRSVCHAALGITPTRQVGVTRAQSEHINPGLTPHPALCVALACMQRRRGRQFVLGVMWAQ